MTVKTLHLTNAYHPTSGGIRTFYRALLAAANDRRRAMRLVVPGKDDGREDVGAYGRIYHVKARRAPAFDRHYRVMCLRSTSHHHEACSRAFSRRSGQD